MIQWLLAFFARRILLRHKPMVVAVTGSVGKTSAKNAIAAVLGAKFRVRSPIENYNNEFGVPLTIIGATSPGKSLIGWLLVFLKAKGTWLLGDSSYPNMLVLEYGLDRPGDIKKLCRLARPDVGVLTAISPVHVEYFESFERLIEEKGEIVKHLLPNGLAVLNGDDANVLSTKETLSRDKHANVTKTVTYGFGEACDVRAEQYRIETRVGDPDGSFDLGEEFCAIHFDLVIGDERAPVVLRNLLGRGQAYSALAAAAVGKHFGLTIDEIVAGLAALAPQPGRMRPIPGIKGCLLLDDSYNAAPASMVTALEVLRQFEPPEGARRVVALGKMAELGKYSADEHRLLGIRVAEVADLLVCVGEEARDIRRGALEAGMDEADIQVFAAAMEAGRWLDFNVGKGDIVLVKGSQSARMEKVTKDLMAEPLRASELLVRQSGKWLET